MLEFIHETPFTTPAILVTIDGYTVASSVASGNVTLEFRKAGDVTLSGYTLYGDTWVNLGRGLYDINWLSGVATELGDFLYVVNVSTGIVPYYGQVEIVAARTNEVWGQVSGRTTEEIYTQVQDRTTVEIFNAVTSIPTVDLDPIFAQVSGRTTEEIYDLTNQVYAQVSGRTTEEIYDEVIGLSLRTTNLPTVVFGASWNGQTVGLSMGLEREGQFVPSATNAIYYLYDQAGSLLASGSSSFPDSQGVFLFDGIQITLTDDTIPYIHGFVTDTTSTVSGRQFFPVVG